MSIIRSDIAPGDSRSKSHVAPKTISNSIIAGAKRCSHSEAASMPSESWYTEELRRDDDADALKLAARLPDIRRFVRLHRRYLLD